MEINEEKTDIQFEPYAIKGMAGDIIFRVSKWDRAKLKKPVLSVQIGGREYKVAPSILTRPRYGFATGFENFLD